MQGLPLCLQFTLKPARAHRHLRPFIQSRKQLLRFFNRRRKVRIGKQQPVAGGLQHSIANAIALATVSWIFDQPNHAELALEGASDFSRAIPRTVVYNQYLCLPSALSNVSNNLFKRSSETGTLVVRGNNDAVRKLGHGQFRVGSL